MKPVPTIHTDRLVLRAWQRDDLAPFAALNADPRVMEHFPAVYTREMTEAFAGRIAVSWAEHGYGLWAVERTDTGIFIGYVGLWPATFEAAFTPAVEVGWRLAAAHWGHGFATEAARAALEFGFTTLSLVDIVSFTARSNVRSWRVMERIGMVHEPELDFEHPAVPEGHPVRPHVFYRITRERWSTRRAGGH